MVAFILQKFPPKNINGLYGYRTSSSMRNQSAWDFAQKKSGRLLLRMGLSLLGVGVVFLFIPTAHWPVWVTPVLFLAFLFIGFGLLFYKVERALRKRFAE